MSRSKEHSDHLSEGEFMRLFVKHEPALRAFARSILPAWSSVDDALQEASVTMWEKLGQLRNANGFLPWAKVILRFKCLSEVSVMRRDRRVLSDAVLELIADEAEAISAEDVADIQGGFPHELSPSGRKPANGGSLMSSAGLPRMWPDLKSPIQTRNQARSKNNERRNQMPTCATHCRGGTQYGVGRCG